MAHRHRRNPDVFGFDLEDAALVGLGIAGTSVLNKNIAHPLLDRAVPTSGFMGKFADAAYALGVGLVGREVVGMASRRVAEDLFRGSLYLAVAKAIGAVLPGYQLDGNVPYLNRLQLPASLGGGAPVMSAAGAIPATSSAANPNVLSPGATAALPGASNAQMLTIAGGRGKLTGL